MRRVRAGRWAVVPIRVRPRIRGTARVLAWNKRRKGLTTQYAQQPMQGFRRSDRLLERDQNFSAGAFLRSVKIRNGCMMRSGKLCVARSCTVPRCIQPIQRLFAKLHDESSGQSRGLDTIQAADERARAEKEASRNVSKWWSHTGCQNSQRSASAERYDSSFRKLRCAAAVGHSARERYLDGWCLSSDQLSVRGSCALGCGFSSSELLHAFQGL